MNELVAFHLDGTLGPHTKFPALNVDLEHTQCKEGQFPFSNIPVTPSQMNTVNIPSIISQRNLWPFVRVNVHWKGQGHVKMFLLR